MHELSAPTVVFWAIVNIDDELRDLGKALSYCLPPIDQTINQTIAGDFGRHPIEKELIGGRQENAHRGHSRHWLKIMIGSFRWDATLAPPRKRTNLDGGLCIH